MVFPAALLGHWSSIGKLAGELQPQAPKLQATSYKLGAPSAEQQQHNGRAAGCGPATVATCPNQTGGAFYGALASGHRDCLGSFLACWLARNGQKSWQETGNNLERLGAALLDYRALNRGNGQRPPVESHERHCKSSISSARELDLIFIPPFAGPQTGRAGLQACRLADLQSYRLASRPDSRAARPVVVAPGQWCSCSGRATVQRQLADNWSAARRRNKVREIRGTGHEVAESQRKRRRKRRKKVVPICVSAHFLSRSPALLVSSSSLQPPDCRL